MQIWHLVGHNSGDKYDKYDMFAKGDKNNNYDKYNRDEKYDNSDNELYELRAHNGDKYD